MIVVKNRLVLFVQIIHVDVLVRFSQIAEKSSTKVWIIWHDMLLHSWANRLSWSKGELFSVESADNAAEAGGGARTQAYIRPVECFHGILSLSSCSWIKERTASHCSSRLCCEDPAKPSPWSSHFLTVSSAPAHWKVLTSASPLLLKSFVFHHHHLKHASSQHLCSLRVSFHHSFMEQKHKKAQKLTAPWYISTSLSPKYGICLKGLTEMSTGPMYVWWVLILKNILWRKALRLHFKGSSWKICDISQVESVVQELIPDINPLTSGSCWGT